MNPVLEMRLMNDKLIQLAARRNGLIAQAEAQRAALAQVIEPWRKSMLLADRGLPALDFIKRHSHLFIGGSVTLFTALRNNPAGKWLRHGWVVWQTIRKLRSRTNKW